MSLFPALRNGNGASQSSQQQQPSAARASVTQAQQQSQAQQSPQASFSKSSSALPSSPLPRLSPSSRDTAASATDAPAAAVPSAFRKTHRAASPSFVAFATPATSGATTTNSLRVTDARMHCANTTTQGQSQQGVDQSSLWKICKLDALNDFLATPGLSVAERALNGSKIRGVSASDAAIAQAASRAHQALDVSKLPGVASFAASFGTNELGGGARILFLQIENTPVGGVNATNAGSQGSAADPDTTVTSPLTVAPGTLSWRIRLPTELDVPLEHWATGGDGSGDDEQRYHEALADRQLFSVRPRKGTLAPGATATIEIIYFPRFVGEHICPILFQSRGGKHFTIVARAETVETMPAVFSLDHCRESFPAPAARGGKEEQEESKESSSTALVPVSPSPFLPSPFPIAYSYRLHDVPLGLSAADTPLQTLALFNHSGRDLRYRVALSIIDSLAAQNHGVRVLEIQGDRVQDSATGEVFLEGLVRAGRTGLLRLAFRPLETKEYQCTLRVRVQPDGGGPESEQSVTIEAKGVHPMEWAITPFPSLSTLPRAQTLLLPGQLAALSEDVVEFGDLPCFARATRVVSLRNLCESERLEFAFRHSIRPAAHNRSRTLEADRRVRTLITTGQSSTADEDDDASLDADDLDPFESLHIACFPARGSLAPGESIQVRIDLNGGAQAVIMERDVAVDVWVAAEDQVRGAGAGAAHSLDHFGFNRTPSAALASRPPVSSSTPAPGKLRSVHTEPRGGRAVHSLVGVGSGFAGADVRVDYPPKEPLPLGVATLARRTAAMKLGQSHADLHAAHTQSATAHLGPTLAHLASVPARATWFADTTAPIREMSEASYNRLSILLRARVLSFGVLEREASARREAYGASQGAPQRLPQQTLTEILNPLSTVQQRFFVPPVEDAEPQRANGQEDNQQQQMQQQQRQPVDAMAASVVEAALHDLLRQSIADTSVGASFHHLRRQPVPFFTELMDAESGAASTSLIASAATAASSSAPALANTSASFQRWSQAILSETLCKLTAEAMQPQRSGFHIEQAPKLFVPPPPQQPQQPM